LHSYLNVSKEHPNSKGAERTAAAVRALLLRQNALNMLAPEGQPVPEKGLNGASVTRDELWFKDFVFYATDVPSADHLTFEERLQLLRMLP
jgi:hypothetical protein